MQFPTNALGWKEKVQGWGLGIRQVQPAPASPYCQAMQDDSMSSHTQKKKKIRKRVSTVPMLARKPSPDAFHTSDKDGTGWEATSVLSALPQYYHKTCLFKRRLPVRARRLAFTRASF